MPRIDYGGGLTIDAPKGLTILEASLQHGLDHRAACGALVRCTTCRAEVLGGAHNCPPLSDKEREVLEQAGFGPNIRLGCCLTPTGDIKIRLLVREQITKEDMRPEGMGPRTRNRRPLRRHPQLHDLLRASHGIRRPAPLEPLL